jgi:hypothetical protein
MDPLNRQRLIEDTLSIVAIILGFAAWLALLVSFCFLVTLMLNYLNPT